jgi:hypothetical protein
VDTIQKSIGDGLRICVWVVFALLHPRCFIRMSIWSVAAYLQDLRFRSGLRLGMSQPDVLALAHRCNAVLAQPVATALEASFTGQVREITMSLREFRLQLIRGVLVGWAETRGWVGP